MQTQRKQRPTIWFKCYTLFINCAKLLYLDYNKVNLSFLNLCSRPITINKL